MNALTMKRGDTAPFVGRVTRPLGGPPVDLTGAKIWMTAKRRQEDPDSAAVFQISTTGGDIAILNAVNGDYQVTVPPSATLALEAKSLTLYFDVQLREVAGNRVTTIDEGGLTVTSDVTQTIV